MKVNYSQTPSPKGKGLLWQKDKICKICNKPFKGITRKCPYCSNKQRIERMKLKGYKPISSIKSKPFSEKFKFSQDTRDLFFFKSKICWECGNNHADSLHHIMKRTSDSPLNAAPINNAQCHLGNGKLHKFENVVDYLKKTYYYLKSIKYQITDKDKEFIIKNKLYYKEFLNI